MLTILSDSGTKEALMDMDDQLRKDTYSSHGEGAGTAARMQRTVANATSEAKDLAVDLGRRASEQFDAGRRPIADTLNRTASAIHRQVDSAANALHRTADKLESTAQYVKENDLEAMMKKAQKLAKRHPGASLAIGVAVGIVVAKLFSTRD
jgi:ElaB/YqjD/DUF883 family membrane-anchored ribosome-binding protein